MSRTWLSPTAQRFADTAAKLRLTLALTLHVRIRLPKIFNFNLDPRVNCATVTNSMCQSTQWRAILATDCPNVCGFCLLGGCIDSAPDCSSQPTVCVTKGLESFVQANCQRTCGLCSSSSTTGATSSNSTSSSTSCGDNTSACAQWVRNGFCTSTFYTTAQKQSFCGNSCGLCSGK